MRLPIVQKTSNLNKILVIIILESKIFIGLWELLQYIDKNGGF